MGRLKDYPDWYGQCVKAKQDDKGDHGMYSCVEESNDEYDDLQTYPLTGSNEGWGQEDNHCANNSECYSPNEGDGDQLCCVKYGRPYEANTLHCVKSQRESHKDDKGWCSCLEDSEDEYGGITFCISTCGQSNKGVSE